MRQSARSNSSYNRFAMLLYYITDRKGFDGSEAEQRAALLRRVAEAARAGVDYIQLREKDLDAADLELLAREVLRRIRENSDAARLLVNSRTEVALAIGADGVHLPAISPPVTAVRKQWMQLSDREPLIGVSAHTILEVQHAEIDGATFAVLAPIFEKSTAGAEGIGLEVLREACMLSNMPVLALGGVRLGNARACLEAGAGGIAGIRLFQEGGIQSTVDALRWLERHVSRTAG